MESGHNFLRVFLEPFPISIESRIETKNMKPKHEKFKSFVYEKNIEVDAEDDLEQNIYESENGNFEVQTQRNRGCSCCLFSENTSEYELGGPNITL